MSSEDLFGSSVAALVVIFCLVGVWFMFDEDATTKGKIIDICKDVGQFQSGKIIVKCEVIHPKEKK